jgi:large subunit ribosomal protein L25
MESIVLNLEPRDVTGKSVKRLRDEGFIPAVIHDHGKDSVVVMASTIEVSKAYKQAGKHHPIDLKAGSKNYTALIKDVDFDPKKNLLRHVVFGAVKAGEKVTAEIPVRIVFDEGNDASPAERAGLVVLTQLDSVEVEALPKDLPDVIEINGETLVEVGDQLTVADLKVPANVTVKTEEHHSIATAFEPSALQAANDDAGGDEEEVTETENPEGETVADAVEGGEENADTKAEAKEEKKD